MASRERDSRRKGKFIYSIFWCLPPTLFLQEGSLHFQFALGHCASSPAHPRYPCFTSLIALHLRAHWIWKLLRRWPSSASVPYSFSLFFFLKQEKRIPASIVKGTILQHIPLHTVPFTFVLVRNLHLNLSFHLNHEIFTFFTSPVQFIQTYTVNFNMYK